MHVIGIMSCTCNFKLFLVFLVIYIIISTLQARKGYVRRNRLNGFKENFMWNLRFSVPKNGSVSRPVGPKPELYQRTGLNKNGFGFKNGPEHIVLHAVPPSVGQPWPLPMVFRQDQSQMLRVNINKLELVLKKQSCDIITYNFNRIKKQLIDGYHHDSMQNNNEIGLYQVNVIILKTCTAYPSLEDDESYNLTILDTGFQVISNEVWGARHALETLMQLFFRQDNGEMVLHPTTIIDRPRYAHRGVMYDTARHYITKSTVFENLEAMAQNKLNVFHWHMTDDNSFPFYSHTYPNLSLKGAFDPVTHVYKASDVADIVEQARLLGIRVVPEFDTPGHILSWGYGQDNLLSQCYNTVTNLPSYMSGPINPVLNSTYTFLSGLYKEIIDLFPDNYLHLGGDEIKIVWDCWANDPNITKWIKSNHMDDTITDSGKARLLDYFFKRLYAVVDELRTNRPKSGKILWQDSVDRNIKIDNDTIVQFWSPFGAQIRKNMSAIYSTCWYLDWIKKGDNWRDFYTCKDFDDVNKKMKKAGAFLLGGEACVWTEYIDDAAIIQRTWPSASTTAEVLWSDIKHRDALIAAARYEENRCRMMRRGVRIGMASGPGHCAIFKQTAAEQQHILKNHQLNELSGKIQNNINQLDTYSLKNARLFKISKDDQSSTDVKQIFYISIIVIMTLYILYTHQRHRTIDININISKQKLLYTFSMLLLLGVLYVLEYSHHLFNMKTVSVLS